MAIILKGAPVAVALSDALTERTLKLKENGISPTLAILRVGERPEDLSYERGAEKRCEKIGISVRKFLLPTTYTQQELLATIVEINGDAGIHGCLMFRPLPRKEDEIAACAALFPEKDIDCITQGSLGSVFSGMGAGYPPCTAQACMEILRHYGYDLTGKNATVIGRSLVIGKPVSMMLLNANATVTVCHTKTRGMSAKSQNAEIVIAAAGKAGVVDARFVRPGQVVIDVGINTDSEGNLCGDVLFDQVEPIVEAITPVPGGVGTVTSTVLAKHVVEAAERCGR